MTYHVEGMTATGSHLSVRAATLHLAIIQALAWLSTSQVWSVTITDERGTVRAAA